MKRQGGRSERPLLIKGIHPVEEALSAGKSLEKIFIQKGHHKGNAGAILRLAQQRNIPVQFVPPEKLQQLGAAHQGIAASVSPVSFYLVDDVLARVYEHGELPLFLICDRITDIRNFGAISRTAFAAGVHAIIIPQNDAASINAEAIKSSAGALHKITLCRENNLVQVVKQLKLQGIQILAAEGSAATFAHEANFRVPTAVILGSEGEGISAGLLKISDAIIKLPMAVVFDSYNVSVAAGMLLYEAMRQRMEGDSPAAGST